MSMRAESERLDWIPESTHLSDVPLDCFVYVNSSRLKRRSLFATRLHAPIECNSPEAKDDFYQGRQKLVNKDSFIYLISCFSTGGRISSGVASDKEEARLAFYRSMEYMQQQG